jgi:hypothetical protein
LRRLLRDYVNDYKTERVHTVIRDAPDGRAIQTQPSSAAKVIGLPRMGGLHRRYIWQEAASQPDFGRVERMKTAKNAY